jgi:carbamate kinase
LSGKPPFDERSAVPETVTRPETVTIPEVVTIVGAQGTFLIAPGDGGLPVIEAPHELVMEKL